jgi:hypothetical protein
VRDQVTFTPQSAQAAIKAILEAGQTITRVVIPDARDEVSQRDFTLPKETNRQ